MACRDVVHPSLTCTDSTCKISRSSTHHRWIHAIVDRVRFPNLQAPFCLVRVQEVKNRSYLRFWLELASETALFGCVVSCHNSFVRLKSKIDRDRAIAKLASQFFPYSTWPKWYVDFKWPYLSQLWTWVAQRGCASQNTNSDNSSVSGTTQCTTKGSVFRKDPSMAPMVDGKPTTLKKISNKSD
jgi:hypothetical protein